jgi:MFS transporter, DHA2 family, multidrug resistance protein
LEKPQRGDRNAPQHRRNRNPRPGGELGQGSASGLSETSAELGGALGIAVLVSLVTVLYRGLTASLPADLPPAVAQIARDTLGGAVTVVEQLPIQTGAALLKTAREAFAEGVVIAAAVCAALAVVAAIMTVTLLRGAGAAQSNVAEDQATQH